MSCQAGLIAESPGEARLPLYTNYPVFLNGNVATDHCKDKRMPGSFHFQPTEGDTASTP